MPGLSTPRAAWIAFVYGECSGYDGKLPREGMGHSLNMRWLKRLLILVALGLLAVIAFCLVGIHLYHSTPRWYQKPIATTQQVKDAANRADQKLIDLFSWAASARAQQLRRMSGKLRPGEAPIGPKTVIFEDDEINSFITSWRLGSANAGDARMSRYFTNGRIVMEDDALILVGDSPAYGTLLSAEFHPLIDAQGNFRVDLNSLRAGLLPIPLPAVADQMNRLQSALQQQLAVESLAVQIDSAQTADAAALGSCWIRLLLASLRDQPAEPVLIIPFDMTHLQSGFPAKVTNVNIRQGQMMLTMQPLTPDEARKLQQDLKQPIPSGD